MSQPLLVVTTTPVTDLMYIIQDGVVAIGVADTITIGIDMAPGGVGVGAIMAVGVMQVVTVVVVIGTVNFL